MAPPSGALSRRPRPSCQPIREPSGETSGQGGIRPRWSNPISPLPRLMLSSSGQAWRPLAGGITVVHLFQSLFLFLRAPGPSIRFGIWTVSHPVASLVATSGTARHPPGGGQR